jgi:hypothetical protein
LSLEVFHVKIRLQPFRSTVKVDGGSGISG